MAMRETRTVYYSCDICARAIRHAGQPGNPMSPVRAGGIVIEASTRVETTAVPDDQGLQTTRNAMTTLGIDHTTSPERDFEERPRFCSTRCLMRHMADVCDRLLRIAGIPEGQDLDGGPILELSIPSVDPLEADPEPEIIVGEPWPMSEADAELSRSIAKAALEDDVSIIPRSHRPPPTSGTTRLQPVARPPATGGLVPVGVTLSARTNTGEQFVPAGLSPLTIGRPPGIDPAHPGSDQTVNIEVRASELPAGVAGIPANLRRMIQQATRRIESRIDNQLTSTITPSPDVQPAAPQTGGTVWPGEIITYGGQSIAAPLGAATVHYSPDRVQFFASDGSFIASIPILPPGVVGPFNDATS